MAVSLGPADAVVIVVMSIFVIVKSVFVSIKANNMFAHASDGSADGFFLAGRSMPFWAVGFSIFASNIGTEHFVGQAGEGANSGMPVSIYEWSAGLLIFFLGSLTPMFLKLQLTTMPEYFERRFNAKCRALIAVMSILIYILTRIANSVFAGAVLFEVVLGVSMWVSGPIILLFTAAYAATGGLAAVMYTDVGQACIFLIGGTIGMLSAVGQIGGISGMTEALDRAELSWFMSTMRPADKLSFPWTGMMIGQPIGSIWYWVVDQTLVQRIFSAKSVAHGQGGCILAGFLKILPPFLMVFPGMIARCFYEECKRTQSQLYPDWCETNLDQGNNANKAYPLLMTKAFPDGVRGLMIVSMLLAMMSSLDSVFNCISTVFTKDIYVRFIDTNASRSRQVWVGRAVTVVSMCFGLLYLPVLATNATGLYLASQSIQSHLAPTLVAVFLLGLFWKRASGTAAFVGMLAGFSFGITRYVFTQLVECAAPDESGVTGDEGSLACMDFNHMALILFGISGAVTIGFSLLVPAPPEEHLQGAGATVPTFVEGRSSARDYKRSQAIAISGLMLLVTMLILCVGFGYSDSPTRFPATWEELRVEAPGTSFVGGEITVSGGVLSIFVMCTITVVVMAVTVWRAFFVEDSIDGQDGQELEKQDISKHQISNVAQNPLSDGIQAAAGAMNELPTMSHPHQGSREKGEVTDPGGDGTSSHDDSTRASRE